MVVASIGDEWLRMVATSGVEWPRWMDTKRTLTWKSLWCLGCLVPAHRSLILGGAGLLLLPVSVFFAPLPGLFLPLPSQFGLFCSTLRGAFELLQLDFICHTEVSACSPTALLQTSPRVFILSLGKFVAHLAGCASASEKNRNCQASPSDASRLEYVPCSCSACFLFCCDFQGRKINFTVTPAIADGSEVFLPSRSAAAEKDDVSSLAVHFFHFFIFSSFFSVFIFSLASFSHIFSF